MSRKLLRMFVLAAAATAAAGPVSALADDASGIRIVVPMPPPTSRPSEADTAIVSDAWTAVVNAQRDARAAHAELISSQVQLSCVTRNLQSRMETGGGVFQATTAATNAKEAYDGLAQPIFNSLLARTDYQEARDAVTRAQQASAAICARADSSAEARIAAAQAVLDAKSAVAQLENASLDSNGDVVAAKKKYVEAVQRLKEIRAQAWQTIRQDPGYLAAVQVMEDARGKAALADQQVAAAKQTLTSAQQRYAEKAAARDDVLYWTRSHGLLDPP